MHNNGLITKTDTQSFVMLEIDFDCRLWILQVLLLRARLTCNAQFKKYPQLETNKTQIDCNIVTMLRKVFESF